MDTFNGASVYAFDYVTNNVQSRWRNIDLQLLLFGSLASVHLGLHEQYKELSKYSYIWALHLLRNT